MYTKIRIVIFLVLSLICILVLKYKKQFTQRNLIAVGVFFILGTTLSTFIPVENYVTNFNSPKDVYEYLFRKDVELVVEGNESAIVIGKKGMNNNSFTVVHKKQDGWTINPSVDKMWEDKILVPGIMINLIYHKKTNEYYVSVRGIEDINNINDSNDSTFSSLTVASNPLYKEVEYYAFISEYNDNYWIEINGDRYTFDN